MDVFFSDMKKTFGSPGDEMFCKSDGKCRTRTLHNLGSVAKIKWVSEDTASHPFTGLFRSGSDTGIIRFSSGTQPSGNGMSPGIGIKLLRDGIDSGNLVAMNDVIEQAGFDFFQKDFETHIPANSDSLRLIIPAMKFATASRNIQTIGLSDFASFTEAGEQEYPVIFPYKLRFHPVYELPRETLGIDYK